MKTPLLLCLSVTLWLPMITAEAQGSNSSRKLSLAGEWRVVLDRTNAGIEGKWFTRALPGEEDVDLPGTLAGEGIGDDPSLLTRWTGGIQNPEWFSRADLAPYTSPENFKFPFWLQPDKYYAGAAWYQREFDLPAEWEGKRIVLTLERPHWETRVWIDGGELGSRRTLSTPHQYTLPASLKGGKHRLTIRVDNGRVVDVGENSHCITDHTQGNWNGIAGEISLQPTSPVWLQSVQIYPNLGKETITVRGRIGNQGGAAGQDTLMARVDPAREAGFQPAKPITSIPVSWSAEGGTFEFDLSVPGIPRWDEFKPQLSHLVLNLEKTGEWKSVAFGFREFATEGTRFLVNGRRTFIRGTLECCIFPLTGHPPTEVEPWKRIIRTAKAHGLNTIRFHSYCPPEAAFVAADQLGFYFQLETCWPNQSTSLGDGKPVDQWVYDETDAILEAYGNHPSFVLMAHGNEPGGKNANAYLARYVTHYKEKDSRRLWTSGSGWPQLPENQFHVSPDPRIQAWGGGLSSRINAKPPETTADYQAYIDSRKVPVISHEIGQWCVYPNFDEIPKYKGYLKPKNFEIFRDSLRAHHMGDQARDFLLASGKLQTLCYKEDIESALRTRGMGGFELLDLHDFPGQGTALVGVLDPFWEYKGYVTDKQFRRFCNSTVPLARLSKRVFTTSETLEAGIEVAHFGPAPLRGAEVRWRLVDRKNKVMDAGRFSPTDIPIDNAIRIGDARIALSQLKAPAQYKLVLAIDGTEFENDWNVWIYPEKVDAAVPASVLVTEELSDAAVATLENGGKVLLTIPPAQVKGDGLGRVELGFSPIFWNTAWTGRQAPHTLGILCNPKSAALAGFPTEFHSDWQWWYVVSRAGAMILDNLPPELKPTVQVIDDWVTNRRLGLLFEAKVGKGKLMVCSVDLTKDLETNAVARQFRHSLLSYMDSPKFHPKVSVTTGQIAGLTQTAQEQKK